MLDLGEITGKFKRQSAGLFGSPAGPAVSFSAGWAMGQCYSETQVSVQRLSTQRFIPISNNHVSNTCVCGQPPERLPGWEIHSFTDESEFKSLSRSLMWGTWNHHEWWLHTRSSQSMGNGSRNSVYERKVYKYPTGKFMFKMCLCKSMPLCSQWQPQWFLKAFKYSVILTTAQGRLWHTEVAKVD